MGTYKIDGDLEVTGKLTGNTITPITYMSLKTARDAGTLIPGMQYRITDYSFSTSTADTASAGHQFDIIVTALTNSSLSEDARACLHEKSSYNIYNITFSDNVTLQCYIFSRNPDVYDVISKDTYLGAPDLTLTDLDDSSATASVASSVLTFHLDPFYFEANDLGSWKLKYCLDNDVDRFEWATNSVNNTGVIYWMRDEFGNEAPYDFKNCLFSKSKYIQLSGPTTLTYLRNSSYDSGTYYGWETTNPSGAATYGMPTQIYTTTLTLSPDPTVYSDTSGTVINNYSKTFNNIEFSNVYTFTHAISYQTSTINRDVSLIGRGSDEWCYDNRVQAVYNTYPASVRGRAFLPFIIFYMPASRFAVYGMRFDNCSNLTIYYTQPQGDFYETYYTSTSDQTITSTNNSARIVFNKYSQFNGSAAFYGGVTFYSSVGGVTKLYKHTITYSKLSGSYTLFFISTKSSAVSGSSAGKRTKALYNALNEDGVVAMYETSQTISGPYSTSPHINRLIQGAFTAGGNYYLIIDSTYDRVTDVTNDTVTNLY